VVGLVATAVAVVLPAGPDRPLGDQVADAQTMSLVNDYERYASQMLLVAHEDATSAEVLAAGASGEQRSASPSIADASRALDYDDLLILDSGGAVLASSDGSRTAQGSRPLDVSGTPADLPALWNRVNLGSFRGAPALLACEPLDTTQGRTGYRCARHARRRRLPARAGREQRHRLQHLWIRRHPRRHDDLKRPNQPSEQAALGSALRARNSGYSPRLSRATTATPGISHINSGDGPL